MIELIGVFDARFPIAAGIGSDAIHRNPVYSYTATTLADDAGYSGVGLAFTLGDGNELVCQAAQHLSRSLRGRDIEEVMADFGAWQRSVANDGKYRWLGPHKGVVHLALASITNACWDLWAKRRRVPLWRLLLDISPEELVDALDLSYIEDVLTAGEAIELLYDAAATRADREAVIRTGYPAYDTSVGWFSYDDQQLQENCLRSVADGFAAVKLKVGSSSLDRDLRRVEIVRETVGAGIRVMIDANQQWTLPQALDFGRRVKDFDLFWFEEPTHPDDIRAHGHLAQSLAPLKLAAGEHVPNRVVFKNYFQEECLGFCQVDALRVAGVSEFIVVSLMAKKFGVPIAPHVGDMGQLHQHLMLFNRVAVGHDILFLEHIPHLQQHFIAPCRIEEGLYLAPQEPGASCDLIQFDEAANHGVS